MYYTLSYISHTVGPNYISPTTRGSNDDSGDRLSGGPIAGIVIVIFIVVGGTVGFIIWYKKQKEIKKLQLVQKQKPDSTTIYRNTPTT